jgi:hypothetical protein
MRALLREPVARVDRVAFDDMVRKVRQHAVFVTRVRHAFGNSIKLDDKYWVVVAGNANDASFDEVAMYDKTNTN